MNIAKLIPLLLFSLSVSLSTEVYADTIRCQHKREKSETLEMTYEIGQK